ncbi:MAG: hypothetical protein COB02_10680 [Candidatus Cloacimonadota bacterium]|nr:MAG: hypothetical protein COB02_10680 [Candidatus Cloacimonadota bacterium]
MIKIRELYFILFFLIFNSLFFVSEAKKPDGSNLGAYAHIKISKYRKRRNSQLTVLVLPVVIDEGRNGFDTYAYNQITNFFRSYNYLVPSFLETNLYLKQKNIEKSAFEKSFQALANKYKAKYVVFLRIKKLEHFTKINGAGVLAAGLVLGGIGRYSFGEYLLKIYSVKANTIFEYSTVDKKKDHILGFWQTSKSLAKKMQSDSIKSLLKEFATKQVHRSEGYILKDINSYFDDAKGFK